MAGYNAHHLAGDRGACRDPADADEEGAPNDPMSTHARDPHPPGVPPNREVEAMIRVDHAGEYGAVRIYEGQLAVLEGPARRARLGRRHQQDGRSRKIIT